MANAWENIIRMFRQSLLSAFQDWLEKNREAIGDKWYNWFLNKMEDASDCDTAIKIMATAMWMFNMVAGFGVLAGIGPNGVNIHEINPQLDKKSTKRLLLIISSCINLQYLPREIATQPIPVISAKQFSLKLFTEQH